MSLTPLFQSVVAASRKLALMDEHTINAVLLRLADAAIDHIQIILDANKKGSCDNAGIRS
ncbi:MAG: hypothetical protein U5K79_18005 [Cyclobacteriaceae bacterium]|nr:hypothetical protein [Cyclobacteriaceae bacterium]